MTRGYDPSMSPGARRRFSILLVAVCYGLWCWMPDPGVLGLAWCATFVGLSRRLWPQVSVEA